MMWERGIEFKDVLRVKIKLKCYVKTTTFSSSILEANIGHTVNIYVYNVHESFNRIE